MRLSNKLLDFIQELANIMYVGGILSHIVISAVMGHADPETAYFVAVYKQMSAYILILPGLALKIGCDLVCFRHFDVVPNWLRIKMLMTVFLAVNAFVFLVPMMPELVLLAEQSIQSGGVSEAFLDKAAIEQIIGMSNVLPLITELVMGSFKPRIGKERQAN